MPPLTRALVRAALAWLVVAFVLLGLVASAPAIPSLARFGVLGPTALHALVAGFTTQLIFGVALWMFPRPLSPEGPTRRAIGWSVLVLLNAGLLLRLVAEPLVAFVGTGAWGRVLVVSAASQALAAAGFVVLAWPRVRGR